MALLCRAPCLPGCGLAAAARPQRPALRRQAVVRAQQGGTPPPPPQQADDEARLEALEAAAKARKGVKAEQAEAFRGPRPSGSRQAAGGGSGGFAEWKEGQLFPEGWEEMTPMQKAAELYMGKRGFQYWAIESAKYSAIILIVGWVLFRFVGPALGLYQLTNDLSTPNFL